MLSVSGLTVSIGPGSQPVDIVSDVSFAIAPGEILGLVGESGCGKSMTSLAIMGLLPHPGPRVRAGRIEIDGAEVTGLEPWQRLAAGRARMSMIFQEPMTSLNPVQRIGDQIIEAVRVHEQLDRNTARSRARELLDMVRIPDSELQLSAFPHQLSGGMRQRVMIAIALASRPQLLIADEPTTALDVTVQFQILGLLRELSTRLSMATLFITHDMGVVAQLADRVAVMYAGRIVETAAASSLFRRAAHPYTRALMDCMPVRGVRGQNLTTIPGQAPQPGTVLVGCAFATRCPNARELCSVAMPPRVAVASLHEALCAFPLTQEEAA
jgi:peptide/nickel transport system ATP-binding protein